MTASLALLLGGCAQPEPRSFEPAASPSPSETLAESIDVTIVPATPPAPTPSLNDSADVAIAVGDLRIAYAIPRCPVTAWLDDAIDDDVSFGVYPEYLTLDDGSRWSSQLVVLAVADETVTEWSFVLSSPLTGEPGGVERRLISQTDPETVIALAIEPAEATITTGFWDSESTENFPQPMLGTVTVTCH